MQISSPGVVEVGKPATITLTLTNQGTEELTVETINLPVNLLAQAPVSQVTPQPASIDGSAYHFSIKIASDSSQDVVFTLNPATPGSVSGEISAVAGDITTSGTLALTIEQAQVIQPSQQPTTVVEQNDPPAANGEIAGVPYKAVVQIIALVDIEGEIQPGWSGSGSLISTDGLILTNAHVVLSDRYYQVQGLVVALTTKTDEQPVATYTAKILQADQALDIAVIKIDTDLDGNPVDLAALNLPTVPLGDDNALNLGDAVTILGYPTIGGSTITLTRGEVAGFTAEEGYGNRAFIKTSATISGGNSGGLAANAIGEMIGIPTQLGYGGDDQYVDCRVLADTNRDGLVDESDNCVPTGGFINALRPLHLAMPLIEAAKRGEVNIIEGAEGQQGSLPEEEGAQVVFQDDFSDPNSGLDIDSWDEGVVGYMEGEYQITTIPQNWLVWSYYADDYDDLIVSVDTRVINPTGVGDFGIICRYVDESNYYAFEVSEDGYFTIWKSVNGETVTLYDWEYSDLITPDGQFTLSAACGGDQLLFGINDVLLAQVTDTSFTTGKVGLIAGTLEPGNITVGFDNFVISQP